MKNTELYKKANDSIEATEEIKRKTKIQIPICLTDKLELKRKRGLLLNSSPLFALI